jgi:hypothetical protein
VKKTLSVFFLTLMLTIGVTTGVQARMSYSDCVAAWAEGCKVYVGDDRNVCVREGVVACVIVRLWM